MAITMYDLAGAEADRRFSPFCWRARMALAHKGLEVETVPWRFTEKDKLPKPNAGRVPVIVDGGRVVHDSTAIADYLEERYADRPSLFGGEVGRGLDAVCAELDRDGIADRADPAGAARHLPPSRAGGPGLFPPATARSGSARPSRRSSRTARRGCRPSAPASTRCAAPSSGRISCPATAPAYADYIVFGAFQWARAISDFELLAADDPVRAWRGRMLDLFGGLAGRAPAYGG